MIRRCLLYAALLLINATPGVAARYVGINLAGGEFGGADGEYSHKYIYPDGKEMRPFRAMGMNVFRVPVRWERLQRSLGGPLDPVEMSRIDAVIAAAKQSGASVILDIHNYARYRKQLIGSDTLPPRQFVNLWQQLASRYRNNDAVIFGLMNEPTGISAVAWAKVAQSAINAIRETGARNLVLVPGTRWSGAHSWRKKPGGDSSNAEAMAGFNDPANNMAFDFHQYFDRDSSGMGTECVTPAQAVSRLAVATGWLRESKARGFLSEFGVPRTAACLFALKAALAAIHDDPRWLGWTVWASSPWFGTYPLNLHPSTNPPQILIIKPFLPENDPKL